MIQQFLNMVVTHEFGYEVVGTANDGIEALEMGRALNPDLMLLDIRIPKISGLVVASVLIQEQPDMRILAVSAEQDPVTVYRAFKIGLHGYLDKASQTVDRLKDAISRVASGKTYYSEKILQIRDDILEDSLSFHRILSPREQEILSLIGGCFSDEEIGNFVGLSALTIQTHRKNIMRKLDFHSTPELIRYATDMGFWKGEEDQEEELPV